MPLCTALFKFESSAAIGACRTGRGQWGGGMPCGLAGWWPPPMAGVTLRRPPNDFGYAGTNRATWHRMFAISCSVPSSAFATQPKLVIQTWRIQVSFLFFLVLSPSFVKPSRYVRSLTVLKRISQSEACRLVTEHYDATSLVALPDQDINGYAYISMECLIISMEPCIQPTS